MITLVYSKRVSVRNNLLNSVSLRSILECKNNIIWTFDTPMYQLLWTIVLCRVIYHKGRQRLATFFVVVGLLTSDKYIYSTFITLPTNFEKKFKSISRIIIVGTFVSVIFHWKSWFDCYSFCSKIHINPSDTNMI